MHLLPVWGVDGGGYMSAEIATLNSTMSKAEIALFTQEELPDYL